MHIMLRCSMIFDVTLRKQEFQLTITQSVRFGTNILHEPFHYLIILIVVPFFTFTLVRNAS